MRENTEKSRFEIVDGETVAGFVTERTKDDAVHLIHTEIDDAYGGQGLGSQLVSATLDTLRERGVAVVPDCPFVARYIQSHPAYASLVPEDRRAEFGVQQ